MLQEKGPLLTQDDHLLVAEELLQFIDNGEIVLTILTGRLRRVLRHRGNDVERRTNERKRERGLGLGLVYFRAHNVPKDKIQ